MSQHFLLSVLRESTVESVVGSNRDVITVLPEEKVGTALRKMSSHQIRSTIVQDSAGNFQGVVDMIDLVQYVVTMHKGWIGTSDVMLESLDDLQVEGNLFFSEKISRVLEKREKPSFQVKPDMSLSAIMEEFSKGFCRTAAVLNNSGKVINVIAQSDVAAYLLRNYQILKEMFDLQIGQMFEKHMLAPKEVITISEYESVMSALTKMATNGVSGLPIIAKNKDKDSKKNIVLGNFSASDIMVLQDPSDFRMLSDHVRSFLEFTQQKLIKGTVTCAYSDTLQDVLRIMSTENVHRVYVADGLGDLQGVISFKDVMNYFIDRAAKPTPLPFVEHPPTAKIL